MDVNGKTARNYWNQANLDMSRVKWMGKNYILFFHNPRILNPALQNFFFINSYSTFYNFALCKFAMQLYSKSILIQMILVTDTKKTENDVENKESCCTLKCITLNVLLMAFHVVKG